MDDDRFDCCNPKCFFSQFGKCHAGQNAKDKVAWNAKDNPKCPIFIKRVTS